MRVFLALLGLLACIAANRVCRRCLEKRFTKNCLYKGYKPQLIEGCPFTSAILSKGQQKKCEKLERKIVVEECGIRACGYLEPLLVDPEVPVDPIWPKPEPDHEDCGTLCELEPEPEAEPEPMVWCKYENSFLFAYAGPAFTDLDAAKIACMVNPQCNGITQVSCKTCFW